MSTSTSTAPSVTPEIVSVTKATVEIRPKDDKWAFGQFVPRFQPNETILDGFDALFKSDPATPMLGRRKPLEDGKFEPEFSWMTRAEVNSGMSRVAEALRLAGLQRGARIGIFSNNRPEFVIAQYGCYRRALVPVPLYATLGAEAIAFIIGHAELPVVFCSGSTFPALLERVTAAEAAASPLRWIVSFDRFPVTEEIRSALEPKSIRLSFWDELISSTPEIAAENVEKPRPSELFLILYTSGTTGRPKGVLILHSAVTHTADAIIAAPQWKGRSPAGETYLSFLPLAHTLEQEVVASLARVGMHLGFLSGSIINLFDDIAAIKPSIVVSVPRVWKRFQERVQETISSAGFMSRSVFSWAVSSKIASLSGSSMWLPWDKIALHKVADRLGGKVRFIISGGAALDPALRQWLRAVLNVPVFQGYGLTETFGSITIGIDPEEGADSIGPPMPGSVARLVDVPEMRHPTNPNTELKGLTVTPGYWKAPEETAASFDGEWFCSGDVGRLNPDGTLSIIDRKKNIFKLSQGEYVAVEALETGYAKAQGVSQIWLYGDSMDSFLVAIVVPLFPQLRAILGPVISDKFKTDAELCTSHEAREAIMESLSKVAKEARLQGFEFVKAVHLEPVMWTPETEVMTPTLKLKRPQLRAKYSAQLDAMREQLRGKK